MSCCNSNCNHDPCGSSFNQALTKAGQYAQYAQTQANKAEDLWLEFNALYLGAFAVAPTQDNEGNPLQTGALYWNSVSNDMFVWNGTAWQPDAFNEFTPFLATGTTFARNLVTRFTDFANVKDFGAIGNGIANDSPAFDAAIASPTDGPVFVPKGNYNAGYKTWLERGVISLADGNSKQEWLVSRKMTGPQGAKGAGTFGGFSPGAYFLDLTEDAEIVTATGVPTFVGFTVRHRYLGGEQATGGRGANLIQLEVLGKSTVNPYPAFCAFSANTTGSVDQGGTNTTIAGSKGEYFGGNWNVYLSSNATNLRNVCGGEINIQATGVGHSSCYQAGLDIACNYKSRGAVTDAALGIAGYGSGHIGYGAGILFSSKNGGQPFSSTSTIIKAMAGPNNPSAIIPTVFRGIDFSEYNITDSILKGAQTNLTETDLTIGDNGDGTNGFSYIYAGSKSTNVSLRIRSKGSGSILLQTETGTTMLRCDATGGSVTQQVRPDTDGTRNLGDPSFRWNVVYAVTATINPSDEREKTFLNIEDSEKTAALEIKQNLRKFKFNSAIEEKGENARIHFGASAQQVGDIMKSHGLDPNKYGFYCYDEWNEIPEEKDNDGNIIQKYRAAGNRYGLRYEELLSFIISAI
jgi:hypothetical protein